MAHGGQVATQPLQRGRRQGAGVPARVVPLDVELARAQHRGDRDVPQGGDHQQRNDLVGLVVDQLHRVQQVVHGQHADDAGALERADQHVPGRGHDRAHRLGDDDPAQRAAPAQPQRLGGLGLPGVHGEDAAAHHFGGVGGLVQGQADDGGQGGAEEVDRLDGEELRAERDAEAERRIQGADVEPEQQLHQQRRGPEDPHIAPTQRAKHRVGRQAHHREHGAEQEAEHHHHGGQPQGEQQSVEHGGGGEVPAHHAPLEGVVADDGVEDHREQQQRGGSGRPAAEVPARHDARHVGTRGTRPFQGLRRRGRRDFGRRDHREALRGRGWQAWVTTRWHSQGAQRHRRCVRRCGRGSASSHAPRPSTRTGRPPGRAADPLSIVCAQGIDVSTAPRAAPIPSRPASGRCLTSATMYCSSSRMTAQQRLVSRDHIDFGRVWSAACCA